MVYHPTLPVYDNAVRLHYTRIVRQKYYSQKKSRFRSIIVCLAKIESAKTISFQFGFWSLCCHWIDITIFDSFNQLFLLARHVWKKTDVGTLLLYCNVSLTQFAIPRNVVANHQSRQKTAILMNAIGAMEKCWVLIVNSIIRRLNCFLF